MKIFLALIIDYIKFLMKFLSALKKIRSWYGFPDILYNINKGFQLHLNELFL